MQNLSIILIIMELPEFHLFVTFQRLLPLTRTNCGGHQTHIASLNHLICNDLRTNWAVAAFGCRCKFLMKSVGNLVTLCKPGIIAIALITQMRNMSDTTFTWPNTTSTTHTHYLSLYLYFSISISLSSYRYIDRDRECVCGWSCIWSGKGRITCVPYLYDQSIGYNTRLA